MLIRLARRSYHRRRLVAAVWVLLLILAAGGGSAFAGKWSTSGRLPGTESQRAYDLLKLRFPTRAGEDGTFVFADVTKNRPAVDAFLAQAATVDGVASVDPLQVSPEGHVAIASFTFPAGETARTKAAVEKLRQLDGPVNQNGGGVEFASRWFDSQTMPSSEGLGLLAAVVVLLVAFGSVLAMGLPLVTAMLGIGITVGLIGLLANLINTADFTPQVATMIGLGVGIDYALFIVTRYRGALGRGASPEEAVVEAIGTAGRAVAFAGCTVMISVLGMFLMGLDFLYGMALGTALAVLVAVAAALTLLPALLGFLGHNIDKLRVHRRRSAEKTSGWARWANFVQRHPKPVAATGLIVLVAAALPVFSLHLGMADAGNDPKTSTTRAAYDLVAQGFGPGANGPVLVVVDTSSQGSSQALPALVKALRAAPGVAAVTDARPSASGKAAIATLIATTGPQTRATETLLHDLRHTVIPRATAGTGLVVHLGGLTASGVDFATVIGHRLPVFIFAVLALSFLLLLVVFRSVLVPLKAVLMNLLSIGAAYGVMVAVFQWGWLGRQVGVSGAPIEAWAPMMLFAIVFGLSMDYEVFLLSAVREHYDATGDNAHAVAQGLAATARLITAAALIMVLVFGSFVLSDLRALKLIGLGLGVAVAVDATIVRIVLVPATMELLGKANWWLPRGLDRILPRFALDTPPPGHAPPASEPELVGAGRP